ncbi:hypothetical protein GCM10028774_58870 [Spirosoma jeollabukense]
MTVAVSSGDYPPIPLGYVEADSRLKDVLYRNDVLRARKERLAKKIKALEQQVEVRLSEIERIKNDDQIS